VSGNRDESESPEVLQITSPEGDSGHYLNCNECLEAMGERVKSGSSASVISIETVANLAEALQSGCQWQNKIVSWIADDTPDQFLTDVMLAIDEVFVRYAEKKGGKGIQSGQETDDRYQTPLARTSVSVYRNTTPLTDSTATTIPLNSPGEEDMIDEIEEVESEEEDEERESTDNSTPTREPGAEENTPSVLPQNVRQADASEQSHDASVITTNSENSGRTAMVYVHEKISDTNHIYQDSGATQYICRDENMLHGVTEVKGVKFKTGNGERKIERAGMMKIMRIDGEGETHWIEKQAYYDPHMPINIIPTGSIDHFHKRSIIHQNGQLFILKKPVRFPQNQVLVRGRLTKSLLYRWDNDKDSPLPIHRRYMPKGAPVTEPNLG